MKYVFKKLLTYSALIIATNAYSQVYLNHAEKNYTTTFLNLEKGRDPNSHDKSVILRSSIFEDHFDKQNESFQLQSSISTSASPLVLVWPDTNLIWCQYRYDSNDDTIKQSVQEYVLIENGNWAESILHGFDSNFGWGPDYFAHYQNDFNVSGQILSKTIDFYSDSLITLTQGQKLDYFYHGQIDSVVHFNFDTINSVYQKSQTDITFRLGYVDSTLYKSNTSIMGIRTIYQSQGRVDSTKSYSVSNGTATLYFKRKFHYGSQYSANVSYFNLNPSDSVITFYNSSNQRDSVREYLWISPGNYWEKVDLYTYHQAPNLEIRKHYDYNTSALISITEYHQTPKFTKPFSLHNVKSYVVSNNDTILRLNQGICDYNDGIQKLPRYVPDSSILVWYPLDTLGLLDFTIEGITSVGRDMSGQKNHWNAGISFIPKTNRFGVSGGAMSFTQNIAQTPFSGVLGTQSRSVSLWLKHKGFYSDEVFFSYGKESPGKRFSGHLNFGCNGIGAGSAYSTITNNYSLDTNWHHLVYVLDASQCTSGCSVTDVKVYVDGIVYPNCNVFNGSTTINTISDFPLRFKFGNNTIADSNRLAIDDFGMWDRALTQDEIINLYSSSTGPKAVRNLQACYYSDDIVSLSWTAPVDTGGDFLGFVIYRADSLNDSFRVVDTLFDYISTYLDSTPYIPASYYPSREAYKYYLEVIDGYGRKSTPSDTVQNVVLEYVTQWATLWSPCPAWNGFLKHSLDEAFLLYESYNSSWSIFDTVTTPMHSNGNIYSRKIDPVVYNCAGNYHKYRVEYGNGCTSNTDSIYNEDNVAPQMWGSELNSSFLNEEDLAIFFDEPNDSAQIERYFLIAKDLTWTTNNPIDSIESSVYRMNNSWTVQLGPNEINNKTRFIVVPKDSCGNYDIVNGSALGLVNTKPIYLDVQYNAGDFQLDWNSREVDSGNVFYTIYEAKYNGAGPASYLLVSNSIDTSADMSLSDSYEKYCYYVSATSSTSNFIMESNRVCVSFTDIPENDIEYSIKPNPSNGVFTLELFEFDEIYQAEVFDMLGQSIYKCELSSGENIIRLSKSITPGSYLLKVTNKQSGFSEKRVLIVQ